ncbi:unnamed protein product [Rhizoctonia solani]|uniref:Uncharacterized protein n=1 Tax=Rhizoctonia solani TaxID=456999 RepID=A0A8H3DDD7_9AGAM|nr:unnamed protein product [Rhizoctonia solani]
MTSNMGNPLLLPEITQFIFSLSGNREQLDLAYTCKQLFNSITPLIWENIRGVGIIMSLIPGVKIVKEYIEDEHGTVTKTLTHILVDETSFTEDWTRYWIYAPFVQHIAPFVSDDRSYGDNLHVHGWPFLFMKLNGDALLPNLRSVDAVRQYMSPCFDQLAWVALFSPPSLEKWYLGNIQWDKGSHDLPIRPFDLLLGAISNYFSSNSSQIIPTRDEWYPSEQALDSVASDSLNSSEYETGFYWFNELSAPINLQYLEIHLSPLTNVLWDELHVLGYLPLLQGLHIRFAKMAGGVEENFKKAPLPSDLFPSLKKLCLFMIPNVGLFEWVWGLKPLVSKLLSAQIEGWKVGSDIKTFTPIIVQLIHENSPMLEVLDFDLKMNKGELGLLETACEVLSTIQLKTLTLSGGEIGAFPPTYSKTTFPYLYHLRLQAECHAAGCATFPMIAKAFPNIEYLYIDPLSHPKPYNLSDMKIDHTAFQSIKIYIPALGLPRKRGGEKQRRFIQ